MNLDTATPAEIDTLMVDLESKLATQNAYVTRYAQRAEYLRNMGRVTAAEENRAYAAAAKAEADQIAAQLAAIHAEYTRRSGWTRAYLVITSGRGHVHRSTACSTCYPTTTFGLLPQVSGSTEAEIIDAAGERACTVCYPDAPVEARAKPTQLFSADETAAAKAREERAAAKAAREAKKTADALPAPVETQWETVTSLRAARTEIVNAMESIDLGYGDPAYVTDRDALAGAIAEKEGKTVEQVIAEAEKRKAQRAKRR